MKRSQYRQVVKPTKREDFAKLLRQAYREDWVERYGITLTDLSQMSISSLRKIWEQVGKDNFIIGGSHGNPIDAAGEGKS